MSPRPAIYCRCGRLLMIKVRREGIILQCPEHGIVLRYKVDARLIGKRRKGKPDENNES